MACEDQAVLVYLAWLARWRPRDSREDSDWIESPVKEGREGSRGAAGTHGTPWQSMLERR